MTAKGQLTPLGAPSAGLKLRRMAVLVEYKQTSLSHEKLTGERREDLPWEQGGSLPEKCACNREHPSVPEKGDRHLWASPLLQGVGGGYNCHCISFH